MEITGADDLEMWESLLAQENYDCLLLDYILIEEEPKCWIELFREGGGKAGEEKKFPGADGPGCPNDQQPGRIAYPRNEAEA